MQGLNVSKISDLGTVPSLCQHLPVIDPVYLPLECPGIVEEIWLKRDRKEVDQDGRGGDELGGVDGKQ